MGRDRQFMDGEGRSESPWYTGVLVCKETVRKRKQSSLLLVKGEFPGMG